MSALSQPTDEIETTRARTGSRWGILALLAAFSFVSYFNRISAPVVANEWASQFRLGVEDLGEIFAALLFGYTLFMTPGGWLIDRIGAKGALVVMGLGSGSFVMLTGAAGIWGAANPYLYLLLARGMLGIFTAPLYPSTSRLVRAWFPLGERALANGLVTCAAPLGAAIAHPLFAGMVAELGWPGAFAAAGAATIGLAAYFARAARNAPPLPRFASLDSSRAAAGPLEPWYTVFANRSLGYLTASYAAVGYFQYLLFYWIGHYFLNVRELPAEQARLYAMVTTMVMGFTMPMGGLAADLLSRQWGLRWGRASVAGIGMVLAATALTRATGAAEPLVSLAWFVLASAAIGLCDGPSWATAAELGGERGGTSAAVFNTGGNIGGVIATYLSALLGEHLGWSVSLWVGSAVCIVGAAFWLLVDPHERTESRLRQPTPSPGACA